MTDKEDTSKTEPGSDPAAGAPHSVSKELLDILACPKCRKPVILKGDSLACTGSDCRLVYPIRDGIPVMLVEEAARE